MTRLLAAAALRPRLTLALLFVVSLGALAAARDLRIDNSTERILIDAADPDRAYNEEIRSVFGGDELLFVLVPGRDVFAPGGLGRLGAARRALEGIAGVERVVSLESIRVLRGTEEAVEIGPLVAPDAAGPALAAAAAEARRHPLVRGDLLSADGATAALLVYVRPRADDPEFKRDLVTAVSAAMARTWSRSFELGGAPYAQVQLNAYTRRDLRRLFPASILVMAALLYLYFRSWPAVVLPLLTVVLALLWTAGAMALAGRSLSMVTTTLPPMLLAVGTSYAVRILCEIEMQRPRHASTPAVILATMREVGLTVLLCGATTMVGFGVLGTSRVAVIAELGLFAAGGTLAATVLALTLVPASLVALGLPAHRTERRGAAVLLGALAPRLHRFTTRRAWPIVAVSALVALLATAGNLRVEVDQDPYAWFPPTSDVARTTDLVDRALSGITPFNVVFTSARGMADPALVPFMAEVEAFLRAQPEVGKVTSFIDHLRILHAAFAGAPAGAIPDDPRLVTQYRFLYVFRDSPKARSRHLDERGGRYNMTVRAHRASGRTLERLVARLRAFVAVHAPAGVEARVTGTGLVRLKTNAEFTRGLVLHVAMAAGLIGALMTVALRSLPLGALALVPSLLPVVALYGILGWLRISLNAATVITGTVAIGNAVDDTVQYLDRYRRRRRALGDPAAARAATLAAVGNPLILSDVILCLGFAVLMASSFLPVATLGLLGAIAMAVSLLANLLLVPALLATRDRAAEAPAGAVLSARERW